MRAAACLMLLAGCWSHAHADKPADYERQWPVTVQSGAGLQRLALPASVLATLRQADLADLRIFNAEGQMLSMALSRAPDSQARERQRHQRPVYPLMASAQAPSTSGWTLRIEEQNQRAVQVDASGQAVPVENRVEGYLVDTRNIEHSAVALNLEGEWPAHQMLSLEISTSKDLRTWTPVGSGVLYRSESGTMGTGGALSISPTALRDKYLRITWPPQSPPPRLTQVVIETEQPGPAPAAPVRARLQTEKIDAHERRFTLPFASRLSALEIEPERQNSLLPVTVSGRMSAAEPWSHLSSGVVYQIEDQGRAEKNTVIGLPAAQYREIRIAADARGAGLGDDPVVLAHFAPVQVVFLASGGPPYTLAAGNVNDKAAYLPLNTLIPNHKPLDEQKLPMAAVALSEAEASTPVVPSGTATAPSRQALWLWAVLLSAVAALAGMVWVLLRKK